ncbi:Hypothetical protein D9617_13g098820 [Elsinoe fawcettii]|nr:Hypothetical protein D9617_13g098820 [Elsinoe fawcettii]
MAEASPPFLFFHVPKNDPSTIPILAQKYRDLRLTGLKLSPNSFSSTIEAEQQYPDEVWQQRLLQSDLETFICAVAPSTEDSSSSSIDSDEVEWIAQLTVRGPIDAATFELPAEANQPFKAADAPPSEERWQVLGLYVLPDFRGHRLAFRLCSSAFDYLRISRISKATGCSQIRLRTMIKTDNIVSVSLFKKLGFCDYGLCTRAEGMVANGETLPDVLDDGYTWRGGTILMRLIEA